MRCSLQDFQTYASILRLTYPDRKVLALSNHLSHSYTDRPIEVMPTKKGEVVVLLDDDDIDDNDASSTNLIGKCTSPYMGHDADCSQ